MRIPTRRGELNRPRKMTDYNLTPAAIERMKRELERLKKHDQPTAIAEVQRTGAMGDFSENAAYQMAKSGLRRINNRILTLEDRINHAIPIAPTSNAFGQISLGSTVVLQTKTREVTYEIVGPQETNPARGRISHVSPLGAVLIGKSVGDVVRIPTRDGQAAEYKILKVE